MKRFAGGAYWLIPILFCTALYWRGLVVWFAQDDLMWLGLRLLVRDFPSFLWAMFAPLAQGTIRPLSERAFFMAFSSLFGLHALPYRMFIFINQFLNIILLMLVARRVTKSEVVGFLAPLLWLANPALVTPMMWTSSYNEIQCTTFFLLSFYLFVRYTETGVRRYFWAQVLTFCLGFGSNELNVVYPAVAAAYAFLLARPYFRSTLPLFGVSAVFLAADRWVAGKPSGAYAINLHPGSAWFSLEQYSLIAFSGLSSVLNFHPFRTIAEILTAVLIAAILGFAGWRALQRDFVPAFGISWFFIVLFPFLLLPGHVFSYYLMIPAIGLSIAAAYAIARAWSRRSVSAACASILLAAYMVPSSLASYRATNQHFEQAGRVHALIQGVVEAKQQHPEKVILLRNVDEPLFWTAIYERPFFRIFGWRDVFLTPENRAHIKDDPNHEPLDPYFFPESALRRVLSDGSAVAYTVAGYSMRDSTADYAAGLVEGGPPLARFIDVGLPYFNDQVGEGWYNIENYARWSGGRAVVYLPGPTRPNQKLYVHGWVNSQILAPGPLRFTMIVDGFVQTTRVISGMGEFQFEYDLPPALLGQTRIEVVATTDRTTQIPPDSRELGVLFGQFAIRP